MIVAWYMDDVLTCRVIYTISGAYEWRNHEEACNYHVCPSAVQIQIIS